MEANEPNAEKLKDRHSRPAVIVCIRDDKARQPEEKVDRQICMVHQVEGWSEAK
jgi:hypothetical protein